jgi:hypothetical protein
MRIRATMRIFLRLATGFAITVTRKDALHDPRVYKPQFGARWIRALQNAEAAFGVMLASIPRSTAICRSPAIRLVDKRPASVRLICSTVYR